MPYWMSHQFWIHDHPFYFILICLIGSGLGWIVGSLINKKRAK